MPPERLPRTPWAITAVWYRSLAGSAGKEPQPDAEIEIRPITLSGSGITRTVEPLPESKRSYAELLPEYYLSQTDFASQGPFFFFGLTAGKHELTIDARGYEGYSETYDVRLGDYQDTIVVELVESR